MVFIRWYKLWTPHFEELYNYLHAFTKLSKLHRQNELYISMESLNYNYHIMHQMSRQMENTYPIITRKKSHSVRIVPALQFHCRRWAKRQLIMSSIAHFSPPNVHNCVVCYHQTTISQECQTENAARIHNIATTHAARSTFATRKFTRCTISATFYRIIVPFSIRTVEYILVFQHLR